MFFPLSKLLPPLIYPLGLACVLLVVALWLSRRRRWQMGATIVSLGLLWLGGNTLVAMGLTRALEEQYLPSAALRAYQVRADAIVVLGGGTRSGDYPRPTPEVNEAGDRLLYGAHLYRRGIAPRILVTGGRAELVQSARVSGAETMADILVEIGVPREKIRLESQSRNTYENAVETAAILRQSGLERIVLVTSATHMPRAVAAFAKTGLEVIPAPTDFQVTQADWDYYTQPNLVIQLYNLLPRAHSLYQTTRALKEYVGILIYRLQGWL
jgi:uncharacterized SAM-binding protein YcdF (DUF218 family)